MTISAEVRGRDQLRELSQPQALQEPLDGLVVVRGRAIRGGGVAAAAAPANRRSAERHGPADEQRPPWATCSKTAAFDNLPGFQRQQKPCCGARAAPSATAARGGRVSFWTRARSRQRQRVNLGSRRVTLGLSVQGGGGVRRIRRGVVACRRRSSGCFCVSFASSRGPGASSGVPSRDARDARAVVGLGGRVQVPRARGGVADEHAPGDVPQRLEGARRSPPKLVQRDATRSTTGAATRRARQCASAATGAVMGARNAVTTRWSRTNLRRRGWCRRRRAQSPHGLGRARAGCRRYHR